MTEAKHIIQKLFVEVNTTRTKEANIIKNNVDLFLKNEILPEIEKLLAKYDNPKIVSRIDNINIQFSISNWNEKGQLKSGIITEFEKQLQLVLKSGNLGPIHKNQFHSIQVPETENSENIFLFFLENGYLPWFGSEEHIIKFEREVLAGKFHLSSSFSDSIRTVLSKNEEAVQRLTNQFSERFVVYFLVGLNTGLKNKEDTILTVLKNSNRNFKREWLRILFEISFEKNIEGLTQAVELWFQFLKKVVSGFAKKDKNEVSEIFKLFLAAVPDKILSHSKFQGILNQSLALVSMEQSVPETFEKVIIQKQKKDEPFLDKKQNEIAVQNAGIVLLHPFFKTFFSLFKITGAGGEIKFDKQDLAVQLLHFLATGREDVFEANLVFEKFICGISLKMPVQRKSLLTPKIKNEAENLLNHVMINWPALKNTSPDGLRQMFLQRDGKLIRNERNFKLIVERKAQDILLEKLSWNVSLMKLPWKKELIFIEW